MDEFGAVFIEYGVVPPLIVVASDAPTCGVNDGGVAVRPVLVDVTVTAIVTVFSGLDASFTTIDALPAESPKTESVEPLRDAIATLEFELDFIEYGVVPPLMVADFVAPTDRERDVELAIRPDEPEDVTFTIIVTVFGVAELSFTTMSVVPVDNPNTYSVEPLIEALATDEFELD
jgi:hypothetical protein